MTHLATTSLTEVELRICFTGNRVAKGTHVTLQYCPPLTGKLLVHKVTEKMTIDRLYHEMMVYNSQIHGWERLKANSTVSPYSDAKLESRKLHVDIEITNLYQRPLFPFSKLFTRFQTIQNTGPPDFSIGIFQGKTSYNVVKLRRIATQLGASECFVIHPRFRQGSAEWTAEEDNKIDASCVPYVEYLDFDEFSSKAKEGYVFVAIEMGGQDLVEYKHPRKAIYILGAEDNGVSTLVQRACRDMVALPSSRSQSFNVTCAGSIVMYDRMTKLSL